jgi:hypothetical protein
MRRLAIAVTAVFLASCFFGAGAALAQGATAPGAKGLESPIGKVVTVEGAATIEHTAAVIVQVSAPSGPLPAKVGDLLYRGDLVTTGGDGKLSLVFADGTALNVLTNARMELNEFVYDPNSKWNSSVFSLVKGTFTFVGGKMAKTGSMKVDTPTATLGIRGTSSHIVITETGSVRFSTLIEEKQ